MSNNIHTKWFEDWFDSPYYHILYQDRNFTEAELFIDKLIAYLNPPKSSRCLDLGCGKGRHSIYLNKKGFDVTGVDLSHKSIDYAKQFENETLHFYVNDMRQQCLESNYDYVFNMFTSFGYFEKDEDNYTTISSVSKALNPGGIFILDFFNSNKVMGNMVHTQTKTVNGIEFCIHKKVENNVIVKQISFTDKGINYNFQERVKAISLADFEKYFKSNNLTIIDLKGNYLLEKFNSNTSDRLILIAQKVK